MHGKKWIALLLTVSLSLFSTMAASMSAMTSFTNSIGMEFVLIPSGSFLLEIVKMNDFGETIENKQRMIISKGFYLGKYPVTQEQWVAVMGSGANPAHFKGRHNPVEEVSWNDAQEFIKRLNAKEGHKRYRLPTEMEWELAARGGTNTRYFFGETSELLGDYAWFVNNSGNTSHPVGQKKPNPFGLYDIYGNVWEWVQDSYAELPARQELTDYRGPESGSRRMSRGGSWDNNAEHCRSAYRIYFKPTNRFYSVGFRLALSPE